MAITMLEPSEVVSNRFEDSHLYDKLRRLVVVSRVSEDAADARSLLHSAAKFDLDDPALFRSVKADYELIRTTIRERGFAALTSDVGELIQARTKGRGHGSTTRAFYARTEFIARMLNLYKLASMPRVFSSPDDTAGICLLVFYLCVLCLVDFLKISHKARRHKGAEQFKTADGVD